MWNSLKLKIQTHVCDNNEHCLLNDALKANEKQHRELLFLRDKKDNSFCGSNLISTRKQAVYIDVSDDKNNYICIAPSYSGTCIDNVNLYGYFGVTKFKQSGDKQIVYTKISYDSDGILHCHIIDFLCSGSCGYGQIMMDILKEYLKNLPVSYINGWISPRDSRDINDPEHGERLHHFYKKCGFYFYWLDEDEYIRFDMKDKNECSKKFIEHTNIYLEKSSYEDNISRLLCERKITMNDLDRALRLNNPNFYLYGLKAVSNNADLLLQTLKLLCDDIDSLCDSDQSVIKEKLIDRLFAYIDPIRYQIDNESIIEFARNAKSKYSTII